MRRTTLNVLIVSASFLLSTFELFGMACHVVFGARSTLPSQFAKLPETGMNWQSVEIELYDGSILPVIVYGGIQLYYHGTGSFTEADIKEIKKVFDHTGSQIWP